MKALLLAAGLGTRLRPLTIHRPKPLCLYYGQALLDIVYRQIKAAGLQEIAINTHYLSQQIVSHVQGHPEIYQIPPYLSYEAEILGTGGCINPLRHWLRDDSLLIYNGDTIADIDLRTLLDQHEARQADATMVLLPDWKSGTNPVYWDGQRAVIKIGGTPPPDTRPATFSGIHIVGRRLLEAIPKLGFHHIIDSYQQLLAEGARIDACIHPGFWADLGAPADYFQAHLSLLQAPERTAICQALGLQNPHLRWFDSEQSACSDVSFTGRLRESFVFGPAHLGRVKAIEQCLVYPNSVIADQTVIKRLIITPEISFTF